MSHKYEVSIKVTLNDQLSIEAENIDEAIKKAKQEAKDQYGLIGDEIEIVEIQEDFV